MSARVRLDVIEIPSPCDVPWSSMRGGDRERHCGTCDQRVVNLSAMTRDEAEDLLNGERACVAFYRRADGTIATKDCTPDRLAAARKAARRSLAVAIAMAGAIGALLVGVGAMLAGEPACTTTHATTAIADRVRFALTHEEPTPMPRPGQWIMRPPPERRVAPSPLLGLDYEGP